MNKKLDRVGIRDSLENLSGYDMAILRENLGGHILGCLFPCLKCGAYVLLADCD